MESFNLKINPYKISSFKNNRRQKLTVSFCGKKSLQKDEFSSSEKEKKSIIKKILNKIAHFFYYGLVDSAAESKSVEEIYKGFYSHKNYKKAKKRGLFNPIPQRGKYDLDVSDIRDLTSLSEKEFEYAKTFIRMKKGYDDKPLSGEQASMYAKACKNEEIFKRIKALIKSKADTQYLVKPMIDFSGPKFNKYLDIINSEGYTKRTTESPMNGFFYNHPISSISIILKDLNKAQIKRAKELIFIEGKDCYGQLSPAVINYVSKMNDKDYEKFMCIIKLISKSIAPSEKEVGQYINISEKDFEKAKSRDLYNKYLSSRYIRRFAHLNDKIFESYQKRTGISEPNSPKDFRKNYELAKLENEEDFQYLSQELNTGSGLDSCIFFIKEGVNAHKKAMQILESQYPLIEANPELYYSEDEDLYEDDKAEYLLSEYKDSKNAELCYMAHILGDTNSFNNFLRLRYATVEEYCLNIEWLNFRQLKLLSDLCKKPDKNGEPLSWKDKLALFDLLYASKNMGKISVMLNKLSKEDKVDIQKLNRDLFSEALKYFEINDVDKIPDEEISKWNKKYLYTLITYFEEGDNIEDMTEVLRHSFQDDFKRYISDIKNIYGKANFETAKEFKEMGLSYKKWLNPSSESNVRFAVKDTNNEKFSQITKQIKEDVETLRRTKAKAFVDKQLREFINDNEFNIPNEAVKNKENLLKTLNVINSKLNHLFKRAKYNLENGTPEKKQSASLVMTIKDHIEQRIKDTQGTKLTGSSTNADLTIKMWDRNPSKDLFQGSYSDCCLALDGGNGSAMPHYLLNTAFNMIEIVDNKSGEIIGNALCYMAKTTENDQEIPTFIIDNIEISPSRKLSDENGIKLRNAIVEYAKNVAKEISGKKDLPLYIGTSYNDVPCEDLSKNRIYVDFLGKIATADDASDEVYLDTFDGWEEKDKLSNFVELYETI